jgi:hypothetical protein
VAKGANENACEHKFNMAGINKHPSLLNHLGNRLRPQYGPQGWNNAEGAMGIAAILNFEFCSHVPTVLALAPHGWLAQDTQSLCRAWRRCDGG